MQGGEISWIVSCSCRKLPLQVADTQRMNAPDEFAKTLAALRVALTAVFDVMETAEHIDEGPSRTLVLIYCKQIEQIMRRAIDRFTFYDSLSQRT